MIDSVEIQKKEVVNEQEVKRQSLPKLDLACGDSKVEGFIGVDICQTDSVDVVHDLREAPWPWEDGSVGEARCSHFFEHLHPAERILFMNELWRVLAPGAGCTFITPRGFDRQVQDFSHVWPPIVAGSYYYFDKSWLTVNRLSHYRELHGIACDFEVRPMTVSVTPDIALRNDEHKMFAVQYYTNAAIDLVVVCVKRETA